MSAYLTMNEVVWGLSCGGLMGLVALVLYVVYFRNQKRQSESFISIRNGRFHVVIDDENGKTVSLTDFGEYEEARSFIVTAGGETGLRAMLMLQRRQSSAKASTRQVAAEEETIA